MAITSIGYQGQITATEWGDLAQFLGRSYAIASPTSYRVTAAPGDRTVNVAPGVAAGRGVLDTLDVTTPVQLPTIAAGTRYDMIVLRRDWSGDGSTTLTYVQGTSSRALPARNVNPGVLDDQPIALVRLTAGFTAPQEIIDLRVWNADGGTFAHSELFGSYMTEVGTQVTCGEDLWTRVIDPASQLPAWRRRKTVDAPMELFEVGGTLTPGFPESALRSVKMQTGSAVNVTNGTGYSAITFPKPFPNGLISVILFNGDGGAINDLIFQGAGGTYGTGTKSGYYYLLREVLENGAGVISRGNAQHRVNWIAFGW